MKYFLVAIVFVAIVAIAILIKNLMETGPFNAKVRAAKGRLRELSGAESGQSSASLLRTDDVSGFQGIEDALMQIVPLQNLKLHMIRGGMDMPLSLIMLIALAVYFVGLAFLKIFTGAGFVVIALLALLPASLPIINIFYKEKKRRDKFESQLPEALDFMIRALRAGHGLSVALGMVGEELQSPIRDEFKIAFDEINYGLDFDRALANMAVRVRSEDLSFFIVALNIQREAGGNLTELLEGLANTIREREKLKGRVNVLASEGKYSGMLLASLPVILGAILNIVNPTYMDLLWSTPQGNNLILTGVAMIAVGALWMWKIVQIKV